MQIADPPVRAPRGALPVWAAGAASMVLIALVPGGAMVIAALALTAAGTLADRQAPLASLVLAGIAIGMAPVAALPALAVIGWAVSVRAPPGDYATALAAGIATAFVAHLLAEPRAAAVGVAMWDALVLIGHGWAAALPAVATIGAACFAAARMSVLPHDPDRLALAIGGSAALAAATLPVADSRVLALAVMPLLALAIRTMVPANRIGALLVQCAAIGAGLASLGQSPVLQAIVAVALAAAGGNALRMALAAGANDNPFLARMLRSKGLCVFAPDDNVVANQNSGEME